MLLSACNQSGEAPEALAEDSYFKKQIIEALSPDGTRKLQLGERGDDSTGWFTQVLMSFEDCTSGVYSVEGKNLNSTTFWKDNDTIVIETSKEYNGHQKWEWVHCFGEKVKVIYSEK